MEMHDPAVRLTLGGYLCLLLIIVSPAAQGLWCYHCASDEPGCSTSVNASTTYEKDCPGAIRCIIMKLQYSYVFPRMLFRTCLYEVDKICYMERGDMELRTEIYMDKADYGYPTILSCLKKSRSKAHLPAPLETKTVLPEDDSISDLDFTVFDTNLGNSWDWSFFNSRMSRWLKIPSVKNVSCYSCEAEIPGYAFDRFKAKTWISELPHCGNKDNDNTPIVECKGAYGCAAFWERKNKMENGEIKTVSRVWRNCWYPGDQKCLRYPYPHPPFAGRSLSSETSGEKQTSCGMAYEAKGRTTIVSWANAEKIQTWIKYNEYLQCTQNIRKELGIESTDLKLVKEESDKKDGNPFAKIHFHFCSPEDKCNTGAPLPPPPPGTVTTKTTTSSTTTTTPSTNNETATSTTTAPSPPNNETVIGNDTYNPNLPEPHQPGCFIKDKGNGACSYHGASEIGLFVAFLSFTLLQNQLE